MTAPNHPRDYTTSRRWSISARSSRILPSVRQRHWTLRRSRARDSLPDGWQNVAESTLFEIRTMMSSIV